MFFLPIVGLCILVLRFVYQKFRINAEIDYDELINKRKKNYRFAQSIDYKNETEIIPLEEVLLINNDSIKRKKIMDTLRIDGAKYIDYLRIATRDKDTETAHYAASAIMEIRKKLEKNLQLLRFEYEKDNDNVITAVNYAELLEHYIKSGLVADEHVSVYRYDYINVIKRLLNNCEPTIFVEYIEKLLNLLLNTGEYEQAGYYANIFLREFPDNERAYLLKMKYYFTLKDNINLSLELSNFKKNIIHPSKFAQDLIEVWDSEVIL